MTEFLLLGYRIRRVDTYSPRRLTCWRVSKSGRLVDSFLTKARAITEVRRLGLV
jgi:hypothetical protein